MGIRDYFTSEAICLVEWPEQAGEVIPLPDISCELKWLSEGREIRIIAHSLLGNKLLKKLEENKNVT
jgi:tRNA threonylcarbamoyladenosine biosynthesis protein TsaE